MKMTIEITHELDDVEDVIISRAGDNIADELRSDIEKDVRCIVMEKIDAQLTALVTETIEKSYQPRDAYGDAKGEPTNLRNEIKTRAQTFLGEKVDKHGETSRHSSGPLVPRLDHLINEIIKKQLTAAVTKEITAAATKAKAVMQQKVGAIIAEELMKPGK